MNRLKDLNPFAVVEAAVTLASLALVGLVVGRQLGPLVGLTSEWAPLITWPVALIFDVLWVGALRMAADAIRQRNRLATAVLGTVAVLAVAASTLILWRLGHMSVFSLMPAGTLAFMGLRLYTENTLADADTRTVIADASLRVRNERALALSAARDMAADAETDVLLETATLIASMRRDEAIARVVTAGDVSMTRTRARMAGKLEKSHRKNGDAAARYAELRAAHRPAAIEPPAAPWADAPEAQPATQVSELDAAFSEALELVGGGEVTVADIAGSLDLAGVCAVHEVPLPVPGESLTDKQVTAILTWLRYSQTPPASFRQALKAFRSEGYRATDKTLQALWRALEVPAEAATTD